MATKKKEAGVPDGNDTFSKNSDDAKKLMAMFKDKTIMMSDTAGQVQKRFAEFHKYKKLSFAGGYNAIRRDMNSDSLGKSFIFSLCATVIVILKSNTILFHVLLLL